MWCIGASSRYRPTDIPEEDMRNVQCMATTLGSPPSATASLDPKRRQSAFVKAKSLTEEQARQKAATAGAMADDVSTVPPTACVGSIRTICGQT